MVLAEETCETILFTTNSHDPLVKGFVTPLKDVVRLLGVYLDRGLTFRAHVKHLLSATTRRFAQLRTAANSSFGPSQSDLRTMYVAYIRSVMEYCAVIWYPGLSNAEKLEVIQNKSARAPHPSPPCSWNPPSFRSLSDSRPTFNPSSSLTSSSASPLPKPKPEILRQHPNWRHLKFWSQPLTRHCRKSLHPHVQPYLLLQPPTQL